MLNWALVFFLIAFIAGVFGFMGVVAALSIEKFVFVIFMALFLLSALTGFHRRA